MGTYYVERLANGLTFIRCRRSGLSGCYGTRCGTYRHGDLRITALEALRAMGRSRGQPFGQ